MGTEVMAPLLYNLVRFTRPKLCLEIGMGYTSLFLAKALSDNRHDFISGRENVNKSLQKISSLSKFNSVSESFSKADKSSRLRFLESPPYLADPSYYETDHIGKLVAIDDLSSENTSASEIKAALAELSLSDHVNLVNGTFQGKAKGLKEKFGPFDFVWFDCGGMKEYDEFFSEYWDLLDPDGGILILHYTLTNTSMGYIRQKIELAKANGELPGIEILSLREPHKMMQNSFTMLRRIDNFSDQIYNEVRDISLERDV